MLPTNEHVPYDQAMVREYSAALREKSDESSEWQQRLADALADVKDLEVSEPSLAKDMTREPENVY